MKYNMIKRYLSLITILLLNLSVYASQKQLTDRNATPETVNLYNSLCRLSEKGVMFGQQESLAKGIDWKCEDGRSDVKELVGEYPALHGWDVGKLEVESKFNFDWIPFDKTNQYIKQVYEMGCINTISWHMNNPVDPEQGVKSKVDSTINKIFSTPEVLSRYNSWLQKLSDFFLNLKGDRGELIPILFRPFHEHTGSWFWWGRKHCSPEEYIRMWRYTVDYLRDTCNVHNLILVYCPDKFSDSADYLERYPGDDYVDILAFDFYDKPRNHPGDQYVRDAQNMLDILQSIAKQKNKLFALGEVGLKQIPVSDWWTNTLLPVLNRKGLSYVLLWRNGNENSYWGPYKGHTDANDFKKFYENDLLFFEKKIQVENVYK